MALTLSKQETLVSEICKTAQKEKKNAKTDNCFKLKWLGRTLCNITLYLCTPENGLISLSIVRPYNFLLSSGVT